MGNGSAKITILGTSGAGKTCYLLGMYHKMCMGLKSFYLKADDDTDVDLKTKYEKLKDSKLGVNRFPAGTDANSEYTFMLQYGFENVMPFEWIDYAGGNLVSKTVGDLDAYNKIKDNINDSTCLLICVDGELLRGNDKEEKIERVKENCVAPMHSFFADYFNENNRLPPTAIVLTKYDVCQKETSVEEIGEIMQEAFDDFFTSRSDIERIIAVIPVSLGANISENNYSGSLKPINIQLPIFMGISSALFDLMKRYQKEFAEKYTEYTSLKEAKEDEQGRVFFRRDKKKIAQLEAAIKENSEQSNKVRTVIEIMTKHSELLLDQLNDIELVYKNNKRTSFAELFESTEGEN